jgi:hypothetical protein
VVQGIGPEFKPQHHKKKKKQPGSSLITFNNTFYFTQYV